ncbi:MAG: hypothetical protein A3I26_01260 [Candidatus Yanofskybacteria bacterium RIFCSPLOWO2_02_FULL_43_10]|uniref:Ribbon-helix-helix protein CopG domain-containing protein n=1 Tax=Candidatus Yanofskybacteria bacterium RIFCSPLOWO2_12_FULL_43_11b TaxID=1802710 RepID=A0A1F8H9A2_9BACT|nr:MAG: hypothetical protein A2742_04055 [Candidatus Yanofskybacteria bacterium RIFCSPHIGHO2_01_FULL_43_32]OGN10583.1 MAG: hypothetical protein A3C69_02435 [Candidatus Yanofskybacteria bacterium RIFCSPHIGHO2_02_FULL_43_12]OGN17784.1 MAG: hypothetical protein A3E34_01395 [Candidatus Yanofskybacteria bacterium RIFCSPHIGHO2_12_FULL_43_11]OGN24528.1 MAG: hypothetical protein A2923_01035 [Candidatus Yanofskybacteria bacterium RIFCSPLOWO2_01_FULL_43_46]OGN28398.1 MAG: hypothetical protein A3I26_01260
MVKVFFWTEEGESQSVNLSPKINQLLDIRARSSGKRGVDILREVLELFGQITEANLIGYLDIQSAKPN